MPTDTPTRPRGGRQEAPEAPKTTFRPPDQRLDVTLASIDAALQAGEELVGAFRVNWLVETVTPSGMHSGSLVHQSSHFQDELTTEAADALAELMTTTPNVKQVIVYPVVLATTDQVGIAVAREAREWPAPPAERVPLPPEAVEVPTPAVLPRFRLPFLSGRRS